jgi:hypothetical protein
MVQVIITRGIVVRRMRAVGWSSFLKGWSGQRLCQCTTGVRQATVLGVSWYLTGGVCRGGGVVSFGVEVSYWRIAAGGRGRKGVAR